MSHRSNFLIFVFLQGLWAGSLSSQGVDPGGVQGVDPQPDPLSQGRSMAVVHELSGRDAAVEQIIDSFLLTASAARKSDAWDQFCARLGIDSTWPSAEMLGHAGYAVMEEFRLRANEARLTPEFVTSDGMDPNDWRTMAMGRAFGEIVQALRMDGFERPLPIFVEVIELLERPGLSLYSSEPEGALLTEREADLFWEGVESVMVDARQEVMQ